MAHGISHTRAQAPLLCIQVHLASKFIYYLSIYTLIESYGIVSWHSVAQAQLSIRRLSVNRENWVFTHVDYGYMDSFRFDKVSDPLELCRRRSGLKLAIGGDEIRAENPQKSIAVRRQRVYKNGVKVSL